MTNDQQAAIQQEIARRKLGGLDCQWGRRTTCDMAWSKPSHWCDACLLRAAGQPLASSEWGEATSAALRDYMAECMAMPDIDTDQEQNWIAGHMFTFAHRLFCAPAPPGGEARETPRETDQGALGNTGMGTLERPPSTTGKAGDRA